MTEQHREHNARAGFQHASELVAVGHAYPSLRVDNDEFMARAEFDNDWDVAALAAETQMKTRLWCRPEENTFTMATAAIRSILEKQPELLEEIDVVVVASGTTMPVVHAPESDYTGMADLAMITLRDLGRTHALGIDVKGCYCTGFLRGLQVADGLLANPNYRAALVVATEQGSRFSIADTNRSKFCFIMSDAAGAAVVRRVAEPSGRGLIDHVGYTAAQLFDWVGIGDDAKSTVMRGSRAGQATHSMLVECARRLMARNGLTMDGVDWLLPIQTHAGIVEGVRQELGCPTERLIWNGGETGFAGSASIPSAFTEATADGRIQPGELVMSIAVGAGMNCAGALWRA